MSLRPWFPDVGRLTPKQFAMLGKAHRRSVGYFAAGPIAIIVDLPKRWQVSDPEKVPVASIGINPKRARKESDR